MKFFEAVPGELFSPLASPNRTLYADALDVLYTAYRENLKIREDTLYSMLRSRLEQQLADATFEGEDIDEEELRDISGRARFLIRKLCGKGWFEKERGDDFEEYITVPSYSSRLLELFHQLRDDRPARGFSYVFGTYSALKVADESESVYDKMAAIYSAYDNTSALINLLQMVYHNVKHYFQMQIDMQDVNQVLASHFNEFGQKVVEAYIRPLKIKDSVPKYRVPIQSVLRSWAEDDALLLAMANATLQDKRGDTVENCRSDLLRKIFWIDERYDNIEHDYLDEIDAQVRRYTRAATQKVENLTNRDQNVRGNLNVLLTALSRNRRAGDLVDQIQPVFQLYEQSFLSEKSLWYRKRPGKRTKAAAVLIQETASDADAAAQAAQLLRSEYGRAAIPERTKPQHPAPKQAAAPAPTESKRAVPPVQSAPIENPQKSAPTVQSAITPPIVSQTPTEPEITEKKSTLSKKPFPLGKIIAAVLAVAVIAGISVSVSSRNKQRATAYDAALQELSNGNYTSAAQGFSALSGYRDAASLSVYCKYAGMYKDRIDYAGGQDELADITLQYDTSWQQDVDALETRVKGYKAEKNAAEEAERQRIAAENAAKREQSLKDQYSGKLPVEGMPVSCLKYTSLGEPDKRLNCKNFEKLEQNQKYFNVYWYDENGEMIAAGMCAQWKNDSEYMLKSFSQYYPSGGDNGQTFNYGNGGSNSGSLRDDYDNPEDLWADNQDWYEDEDEAWDEWENG